MKANQTLKFLRLLTAGLILLLVFTGAASAVEVTIDVPTVPVQIQQVITIPVTLHGANDIISFEAQVSNNVAGATITINETGIPDGMSAVNSKPEAETQYIAWMSAEGVTADAVSLFYIDILITDVTLQTVPVMVTVTELAENKAGILLEESYHVASPVVMLTKAGANAGIVVPTEVPTTSDTTPTGTVPTETVPTETVVPTATVPHPPFNTGTEQTTTQTPGFSILLVFAAVAGVILIREGKQ